jgi:hypothetical protein
VVTLDLFLSTDRIRDGTDEYIDADCQMSAHNQCETRCDTDGLDEFCVTDEQRATLKAVRRCKTVAEAASQLDATERAVYKRIGRLRAKLNKTGSITFQPVPDSDLDVTEIWAHRKKQFRQKAEFEQATKLRDVRVRIQGPIGILHYGDPHVDDDGTDIEALELHCRLVRETEGLFGANIGDTTNNWVGRLSRLYGQQGTTAEQAWKMAEYFLHFCPQTDPVKLPEKERKSLLSNWIYLIAGNHDAWSGAGDPLKWILRQADAPYEASQVRLNLIFPNGRECRINARHDFKGTSQWNPAHGSMKASQMGFHDHVLVNGHRHKSGYGLIKDPDKGTVSHCIQVASYKVHDSFAREHGFPDQHISPSVVTVIDPDATEAGFVTVFHDVEEAVEFLRFKRS